MFRLESVLQLKDDENLQAMVRRHMATLIGPLFLALLFIVVPFFFLFPLFSLEVFGIIIFGISIIIGGALAFRTIFIWDSDVLLITNMRVIDVDQKGMFFRNVSEASLGSIQDVSWSKKGILATLFGMGAVKIQTAGASAVLEAENISRPERVHELINQLKDEVPKQAHKEEGGVKDRRSRIRHIAMLLEELNDDQIAEVEKSLEKRTKDEAVNSFLAPENK